MMLKSEVARATEKAESEDCVDFGACVPEPCGCFAPPFLSTVEVAAGKVLAVSVGKVAVVLVP